MGGQSKVLILPLDNKRRVSLFYDEKNYLKNIWIKAEKYSELKEKKKVSAKFLLDIQRVVLFHKGKKFVVKVKSGRRVFDEISVEESIQRVGYYSMTVSPEMKIHRERIEEYLNLNIRRK
ncbi:hypothetical protein [Enterococcus sp. AZ103]|uniref:hypothetical protein n=1 Tax=Enterococcus sp. AZ103 TaxID=2774628 RepID=UPI003F28B51C